MGRACRCKESREVAPTCAVHLEVLQRIGWVTRGRSGCPRCGKCSKVVARELSMG